MIAIHKPEMHQRCFFHFFIVNVDQALQIFQVWLYYYFKCDTPEEAAWRGVFRTLSNIYDGAFC